MFQACAQNLGTVADVVLTYPGQPVSKLQLELRLNTATGSTVDIAAADFYGTQLPRLGGESDAAYISRIISNLFIRRLTRPSIFAMLQALTGINPRMIDNWRPSDVGGYSATTGVPFLSGGLMVYDLAAGMPASYLGVDIAGAPFRYMNAGGRFKINPGFGWQGFIDTTYPAGFGAQGNPAPGMLCVLGSSPPTQYGGTFTAGSPSVYTNFNPNGGYIATGAISTVGNRSYYAVTAGDPTAAMFNPQGLVPNDLARGRASVLTQINRMRAEGITIWARCVSAAALAAQGWTS